MNMSGVNTVRQLKEDLLKEQIRPSDGGDHKETMLDILNRLDNVEINVPILTKTLIGRCVSELKSHGDRDVASMARKLVKKWKSTVARQQAQHGKTNNNPTVAMAPKKPLASNIGENNFKTGIQSTPTTTSVVNVKVAHIRPRYDNLEKWCSDPRNVYIGRRGIVFVNKQRFPKKDSPFCNPFKISKTVGREKVLANYRSWADQKLKDDELFRNAIRGLRGKKLGCWCHPEGCHGHILKEYADMNRDLFLATFGTYGNEGKK